MRRSRFHPLIAIICALCLLAAQQAGYLHFLGHFGFGAERAMLEEGQADHGMDGLSHACSACAAFAALDAAPPQSVAPTAVERVAVIAAIEPGSRDVPAYPAPPYSSRAPPAVL